MNNWIPIVSPEQAVQVIQSGNRVFIHSVAQTPHRLIAAMVERAQSAQLSGIEVCHMHTEGHLPYCEEKYNGIFKPNAFFYRCKHAQRG